MTATIGTATISVDERRARLAEQHRLLPGRRTDDLTAIADDLVALHSSDPVTVYLSALARMANPSLAAVDRALYGEDRTLFRHHAMRRTLWVASAEVVRLMHAAATRKLYGTEFARTTKLLAAAGVEHPEAWLTAALEHLRADLREHGPGTARELGERVSSLRQPLELAPGKAYGGAQSAHTRVIVLLGFAGEMLRTRPAGTWVNGAYRYVAADSWLPGGLGELDLREAAGELAGRWLSRFGPATTADLQWWMGWTGALTQQALIDCGAVEVSLDDGPAWLAADDQGPPATSEPWVAVLPSLDPTTMGWKQRDWYLPPAAAEAFDRNGNAGPTLWVDGRVVGAWAQTTSGELRTHFFERVSPPRRAELADRLVDLAGWVEPTRFTVRFPGRVQARILAH
ncbi:MAG TPA: winged helix DNA-binding domain-containing protein [Propionibacteriaceae bacterium]